MSHGHSKSPKPSMRFGERQIRRERKGARLLLARRASKGSLLARRANNYRAVVVAAVVAAPAGISGSMRTSSNITTPSPVKTMLTLIDPDAGTLR